MFYPDSNLGKDFVLVLKRFSLHEWQRAKSLQDFKWLRYQKGEKLVAGQADVLCEK